MIKNTNAAAKVKMTAAEKMALVQEARERIDESWQHDRDNRNEAAIDLNMLSGDQWDLESRKLRETQRRPMLTINRLPQFVRQVTNDIRQADFAIKVVPEDDESDPELAEIYEGLLRQIQYRSSAKHVYSTAAEHQASCGIGFFRITTQYCDDTAFDQEIMIKPIRNPMSVYFDPAAVEPDRSDAMWCAVTEMIPRKTFKLKYPKASEVGVEISRDGDENHFFWSEDDSVRVAEYWRKVPVKKTIALLETGETIDITKFGEAEAAMYPIVRTRQVDTHKVECVIVSGADVLEGPFEWAGKHIPVVPVIGGEFPLEGRTYRYGVIRFARDPQRLYNYYRTATAEAIALVPKSPYIGTAAQIAPYKSLWDNAHKDNPPYLLYGTDPDAPGPPQRQAHAAIPTALVQETQVAADDMKSVTGIYDSALGQKSNETSGVAIGRRQLESDVANYHFADNLQRSLEYAGRILIDLIPKIYDNERVLRLMGENPNDEEKLVRINQVVMGVNGMPIMINDLSAATFDIRVKVGKSYTTKRAEAADSLLQFVQAVPNAGAVASDLIAESFDWPGAEQLAKRLRNTIPPEILADPNGPQSQPPPPDPVMKQMAALEMADKQAKIAKTNAETESKRIDSMIALAQAMMPPEAVSQTFPIPFQDGQPAPIDGPQEMMPPEQMPMDGVVPPPMEFDEFGASQGGQIMPQPPPF